MGSLAEMFSEQSVDMRPADSRRLREIKHPEIRPVKPGFEKDKRRIHRRRANRRRAVDRSQMGFPDKPGSRVAPESPAIHRLIMVAEQELPAQFSRPLVVADD